MADLRAGDPITEGRLYRRIPNWPNYFKDGRPTSLNFRPDSGEDTVSMTLASVTTADELLAAHPGFGYCALDVARLLELGLTVTYTPEHGKGHVDVRGLHGKDKVINDLRRQVSFLAIEVHAPVPAIKP